MKNLYLIRHAKSDWSDLSKSDFERGLNKRGEKAIFTMADALKEKGVIPDLILSSSATRAKLTARGGRSSDHLRSAGRCERAQRRHPDKGGGRIPGPRGRMGSSTATGQGLRSSRSTHLYQPKDGKLDLSP